MNAEGNISNNL